MEKIYSNFNKSRAEQILSCFNTDIKKGGEGSRGGKVIGHTKSGKPVYEHFEHPSHKDFNQWEHADAAAVHAHIVADKNAAYKNKHGEELTYDEAWKDNKIDSHKHTLAEKELSLNNLK